MRHLSQDEMAGLVFDEVGGSVRTRCLAHLDSCPACTGTFEDLCRAAALLEREPLEPAPVFAWARLEARIGRPGDERDWPEPAWVPLILAHAAGVALLATCIAVAGAWLETASVWESLRAWPVAREIGARGIVAVAIFAAGALATMAMAPVLWWESRRQRSWPLE
jgi:hypothetical protein